MKTALGGGIKGWKMASVLEKVTEIHTKKPRQVLVGAGDGIKTVRWANDAPMALMAGTCALEGKETTFRTAEALVKVCDKLGIPLVYKGSFDKANRTSPKTPRGMGMDAGLQLLGEVRKEFGIPLLTDVHEVAQVEAVMSVVDVIQVPAFLSRQTDLVAACGKAAAKYENKAVNIKKGQFMAPIDMHLAVTKAECEGEGTENVILTERGVSFGYNTLVVDYRAYGVMKESGCPVVHDASHCIMMPAGRGDSSGGDRSHLTPLAKAAIAVGVAGIFLETHPDPANATSDKETQWPLEWLEELLTSLKRLDDVAKTL